MAHYEKPRQVSPATLSKAKQLVNLNVYADGRARGCTVRCLGVTCNGCPMNVKGVPPTLAEVRAIVATSTDQKDDEALPQAETKKTVTGVVGYDRNNNEIISTSTSTPGEDPQVRNPSHYQVFEGLESIEVIARSMTMGEFRGFCMGNVLKYRLRAGKKSDQANVHKDLSKADFYKELFTKYVGYCYDAE